MKTIREQLLEALQALEEADPEVLAEVEISKKRKNKIRKSASVFKKAKN